MRLERVKECGSKCWLCAQDVNGLQLIHVNSSCDFVFSLMLYVINLCLNLSFFMITIQVLISMSNESFFRLSVMFIALNASTAVAKKP